MEVGLQPGKVERHAQSSWHTQLPFHYGPPPGPALPFSNDLLYGSAPPRLTVDTGVHGFRPPSITQTPYNASPGIIHHSSYPIHHGLPMAQSRTMSQSQLLPPDDHQYEMDQFEMDMENTMVSTTAMPMEPVLSQHDQNQSSGLSWDARGFPTAERRDSHFSDWESKPDISTAMTASSSSFGYPSCNNATWQDDRNNQLSTAPVTIANNITFMANHLISSYGSQFISPDSAMSDSPIETNLYGSRPGGAPHGIAKQGSFMAGPENSPAPESPWRQEVSVARLHDHPNRSWLEVSATNPFEFSRPASQAMLPSSLPMQQGHVNQAARFASGPALSGFSGARYLPHYVQSRESPWPSDRMTKDEIIRDCRARGMSYKDIKREYNFHDAESTLRGRHRTLTKEKRHRVRKPIWSENDRRLLREGVVQSIGEQKANSICDTSDVDRLTIPWKEVSAYITRNGGSYAFGYATCKKKYVEYFVPKDAHTGLRPVDARRSTSRLRRSRSPSWSDSSYLQQPRSYE